MGRLDKEEVLTSIATIEKAWGEAAIWSPLFSVCSANNSIDAFAASEQYANICYNCMGDML